MPYPAQVNRDALIEAARQMIEAEGSAEKVTLARLADRFGISAPSLYRHVQNKIELLQAVNLITLTQMTAFLRAAIDSADPDARARVIAMGRAYRDFALQHPVTYHLAYAGTVEADPDPAILEALAIPLQQVMAALVGAANSLAALRGAWALMHGFVLLEIQGRFRRGGDVEAAFFRALQAYIDGWG